MPVHSLLFISSGQGASLAFLVYEILITLDDEVNAIWSKPRGSWIKWQFLFTRYFALAAQLTNRAIESSITSHMTMVTIALRNWYMCQVIVGSILMSAVEIVLMARVYALYNKNIWVGLGFIALIIGELTTVVIGVVMNIPGDDFGLESLLLTSPISYTYFGIGAIISQITILGLTLMKYRTAVRGGWEKVPIMMLMVRDGTVAFFILLIATTMTVVATSTQNEYAPIGNSWFLSIVACAGCRLIINMQNLPNRTETSTTSSATAIQLTTLWNDFDLEVIQVSERCAEDYA
ncbi:hypothetical protein B0H34DRAFT_795539 [Crassisporium funariophilum]|nr:hypothetical protein B0H34DRAFT_795539 [Crassisporium funariophilum]